jgi:hypothetical protein
VTVIIKPQIVLRLSTAANRLSSRENHSRMKFLAEDFNRLRHVACFKMMNHQAIFKNGYMRDSSVNLLSKRS